MRIDVKGISRFKLVKDIATYERTINTLGLLKGNWFGNKKNQNLSIDLPFNTKEYTGERCDKKLQDFPITSRLIYICIMQDYDQTLWQLAIRISEYNCINTYDNYRILAHIMNNSPEGIYFYSNEYSTVDCVICWKPSV